MSAAVPIVSPHDQRVTFVELFFDLVFVFSITQVVSILHGHIDARSAGTALLVFWMVWWAWTQFTWALNAANTDHPRVQLATLAATAVAFFLAVGVPGAFGGSAMWFAVPYVTVRLVGLLIYHWVASPDPLQAKAVRIFGGCSLTGLAAVIAGAVVGGTAQYWWWGAAIVLDLVAAEVGASEEGWNLHPEHFAERHGLIVIIALGEALIVAASGLVGHPATPAAIAAAVAAVALTCGLWWVYFQRAKPRFEHAMATHEGSRQSRLARDVFSILHFPMLCGVIAMAAATEVALVHPDEVLPADVRLALGGAAVLFVAGSALAMWRACGRAPLWRIVLPVAAAVSVFAIDAMPWGALVVICAMLVALALIEHRESGSVPQPHEQDLEVV